MFLKYRVKPIHSESIRWMAWGENETVYAVQRKIFIWWTIKYFDTYRGADLWIDKNIMDE